ncbi:MAG: TolC family outer membrane protein [Gammaproteobacteria bacterium]|nr:TolC family outer membrane protein [Gammaproteobacteria bacterium]
MEIHRPFKFLLIVILSFFVFPVYAQTLQQAVDQTIQTNPNILIKLKAWLAAKEGIKEAEGGYFPRVDAFGDYGREQSKNISTDFEYNTLTRRGIGIVLHQMIFDGFATSSEVSRNENLALADSYQFQGTANDTALLAVKAYLDVLRTQSLLKLAKQNYATHQNMYRMIKLRADSGLTRKGDIAQTFGRLALAKANLLAAQSNYQDAVTLYKKVIGTNPVNLSLPKIAKAAPFPVSEQNAINRALENHPILKSAEADIEEAKAQYKASQANNYPKLDLELAAANERDANGIKGPDIDKSAMLMVRYNFFRGGSDVAKQQGNAFRIEQAQSIRTKTYREVAENARYAWEFYKTAQNQLPYYSLHQNASIKTVSVYRKEFQLGKRSLLDLLDSENELFTASIDYINGKYNVLFSKYRLLNSEDALLDYLNIKVPDQSASINNMDSFSSPSMPTVQSPKVRPTKKSYIKKTSEGYLLKTPAIKGKYVIQLFGSYQKQEAINFIHRYQLARKAMWQHTYNKGKNWYIVTVGNYRTWHQAKQARSKLSGNLMQLGPWIRATSTI